jgi:hypothetical protein
MPLDSLRHRVQEDARAAGVELSFRPMPSTGGGADEHEVLAELGPILFRFVRERGQDWVELAPEGDTRGRFFLFDDVEIAFGWKTVTEVLDQKDVEPLSSVLRRIAQRWKTLAEALSTPNSIAWARIAAAAEARGEAFAERLR